MNEAAGKRPGPHGKGQRDYCIGGLKVRSRRRLPGLPEASFGECDLEVLWSDESFVSRKTGSGLVPHPGGRLLYEVASAGIRVAFEDHLDVEYMPGAGKVRVWSPRRSSLYLSHQIADSVIPLVLSINGRLVFHGAGLMTARGCVAVLGPSMAGKSTLTAHWASKGGEFVSDDWFALDLTSDLVSVSPSHPSIRLREASVALVEIPGDRADGWNDEYSKHWYRFSNKVMARVGNYVELAAIVCYRRDASLLKGVTTELSRKESVVRLLSHVFILDVRSKEVWKRTLENVKGLVERVPVWELCAREGRDGLAESAEWLRTR